MKLVIDKKSEKDVYVCEGNPSGIADFLKSQNPEDQISLTFNEEELGEVKKFTQLLDQKGFNNIEITLPTLSPDELKFITFPKNLKKISVELALNISQSMEFLGKIPENIKEISMESITDNASSKDCKEFFNYFFARFKQLETLEIPRSPMPDDFPSWFFALEPLKKSIKSLDISGCMINPEIVTEYLKSRSHSSHRFKKLDLTENNFTPETWFRQILPIAAELMDEDGELYLEGINDENIGDVINLLTKNKTQVCNLRRIVFAEFYEASAKLDMRQKLGKSPTQEEMELVRRDSKMTEAGIAILEKAIANRQLFKEGFVYEALNSQGEELSKEKDSREKEPPRKLQRPSINPGQPAAESFTKSRFFQDGKGH